MDTGWQQFRRGLSLRLKVMVMLILMCCGTCATTLKLLHLGTVLPPLMIDRTSGVLETMRRDVEFAVYAGVPIEHLRGVPDYAAELAAETPEIKAINFHILTDRDRFQRERLIIAQMPSGTAQMRNTEPFFSRLVATVRMLVTADGDQISEVVRTEVRAYGEPVAQITAELDMGYLRNRMLDTLLDTLIVVMAAILFSLEMLMVPVVQSLITPLQAIQRYLVKMGQGEFIQSGLKLRIGKAWRFLAALQQRNALLRQRAENQAVGHARKEARTFIQRRLPVQQRVTEIAIFDARLPLFVALFAEGLLTAWMPLYARSLPNTLAPWVPDTLAIAVPIAMFTAALIVAMAVSRLWWDRVPLRLNAIGGLLLSIAGLVGASFANDIGMLTLARAVSGAGLGLLRVACVDYALSVPHHAADRHDEDGFSKAFLTSGVTGLAIGAVLADWAGPGIVFVIAAGVSVFAMVISLILMDGAIGARTSRARTNVSERLAPVRAIFTNRRVGLSVLLFAIPLSLLDRGFILFLVPLALSDMGLPQSLISHVITAYALLMIGGYAIWAGILSEEKGFVIPACATLGLIGLGLIALGARFETHAWIVTVLLVGATAGLTRAFRSRVLTAAAIGEFTLPQVEFQKGFTFQIGGFVGPLMAGVIMMMFGLEAVPYIIGFVLVTSTVGLALLSFSNLFAKELSNA
ncbi:MAG: MFS transporter [Pseudomonadota bacterium]